MTSTRNGMTSTRSRAEVATGAARIGGAGRVLTDDEVTTFVTEQLDARAAGAVARPPDVRRALDRSPVPWGVLAHSTHLRGAGTYDAGTGEESLRVRVTLATGIQEQVCRAINLGYLDPHSVDPAAFAADPGTLVVPRAGEVLFRLR